MKCYLIVVLICLSLKYKDIESLFIILYVNRFLPVRCILLSRGSESEVFASHLYPGVFYEW